MSPDSSNSKVGISATTVLRIDVMDYFRAFLYCTAALTETEKKVKEHPTTPGGQAGHGVTGAFGSVDSLALLQAGRPIS